ncbi:DUF305 domain-containing protein [Zhihengliuella salsuginis]|uniref:DUF305 domain-containing protein n=2 Tax=Zhihengliuella salsuginis TaxID=578222 RepID=A0ABQ3GGW9_9MICC|nr:DUF305 domain-containing protein [Zhihengliuella salsuginis]
MTRSAAVLAIGAIALAGCATGNDDAGTTGPAASSAPGSDAAASNTASAEANEADIAFATGMIPHHRQAIEMSGLVLGAEGLRESALGRGTAELAVEIKAAQGPEIGQLEKLLDAWGARDGEHSGHGGMDGMMSEDDLAELQHATGDDAAKLFLEQMIAHHEGAVTMAQTVIDEGQNAEARELAQEIIDAQDAEISRMRGMLEG